MQACKSWRSNIIVHAQSPIKNSNHGFIISKLTQRVGKTRSKTETNQTGVIKRGATRKSPILGIGDIKINNMFVFFKYRHGTVPAILAK